MLLYLTDIHFQQNNPISRKDDFVLSLERKFQEITQICKDRNVSAILCGGDIFHHWSPRYSTFFKMCRLIQNTKTPWYVVAGNHDLRGGNLKTLDQTAVGALARAKVVNLLTNKYTLLDGFGITGYSYQHGIEKSLAENGIDDDAHITVVHAMITENPFFGEDYVLCQNVRCSAKYLLTGHYHPGFPDFLDFNDTVYINPSALARITCHKTDRRMPAVVLVDPILDNCELIVLQSATSINEAFVKEDTSADWKTQISNQLVQPAEWNFDINEVIKEVIDKCRANRGFLVDWDKVWECIKDYLELTNDVMAGSQRKD
ncbi:MAG: metallophosphoesterase [Bacillota bacterium]